jgi:hypothetical protein
LFVFKPNYIIRAPVLVAIALIEYGMDPMSAVALIRERRFINYFSSIQNIF